MEDDNDHAPETQAIDPHRRPTRRQPPQPPDLEQGHGVHFGCDLKNPNFAALAEAVGLTGLRVEEPAEVRPALELALKLSGPVLVDVVTDPNVLSMPPKATIQQAKGFALAMTKMAFTGELHDVIDTVAANWRYV